MGTINTQEIEATISLLKKYSNRNLDGAKTAMAQPKDGNDYRLPFVKQYLYNNFAKISDDLALGADAQNTGKATIDQLVDYCGAVKGANNDQLLKLNSGAFCSDETSVSAMTKYAINTFGKELNSKITTLKSCGFTAHEAKDITDDKLEEFTDKMEKLTPDGVNKQIVQRVTDATKNFIEDRNEKNDQVKDIYNKAKTELDKAATEEDAAKVESVAKLHLTRIKGRTKGVMESLVENISESAIKNDIPHLKTAEGELCIESVMEDAMAIYAVMEAMNMYGLVDMNRPFVDSIVASFTPSK